MIPILLYGAVKVGASMAGKMMLGATAAKIAKDVIDDKIEDARKEGYIRASREYEEKFGKQVEAFEKEIKNLKNDLHEYKNLCKDLEKYIAELETEIERLQKDGFYELADERQVTLELTRQGLKTLHALKSA